MRKNCQLVFELEVYEIDKKMLLICINIDNLNGYAPLSSTASESLGGERGALLQVHRKAQVLQNYDQCHLL